MSTNKFELGDEIRDRVTGIQGIATARIEYLNGCTQYGIQQKADDAGKVPDLYYIDHTQLELVATQKVPVDGADTGGPMMRSAPISTPN